MRLYDLATVVRSKNAGPFTLTIDLLFDNAASLRQVVQAPEFSEEAIAALYRTAPGAVRIRPFERALAIKISLPRPVSSGSVGDLDVYGSQQHLPLGEIEVAATRLAPGATSSERGLRD